MWCYGRRVVCFATHHDLESGLLGVVAELLEQDVPGGGGGSEEGETIDEDVDDEPGVGERRDLLFMVVLETLYVLTQLEHPQQQTVSLAP